MNSKRVRFPNLLGSIAAVIALALAIAPRPVLADDIDVYSNPPGMNGLPNVLIIIDNTANWGAQITFTCDDAGPTGANLLGNEPKTKMGAEKCAMYKLFSSMSIAELGQYNFAFMLFNRKNANGGYPRLRFINVKTNSDKNTILNMLRGLELDPQDKSNNPSTGEAFYEALLWFSGGTVRMGKASALADAGAFNQAGTRYLSPSGSGSCAKNHIIYLANGSPNDSGQTAENLLKSINSSAAPLPIPAAEGVGKNDLNQWADEYAAFFYRGLDLDPVTDGQQNIQVHTIAVTGASSDGNYPNYIRWMAQMGGGLYQEASNVNDVIQAFKDALNQIRGSNAVFAAAALPVSANTQGAYLNQVFIGMFRPDSNAYQRWVGNLKQYQFKYNAQSDTLSLADSLNQSAVSLTTGFINSSAVSFWTQPSSFWINAENLSNAKYNRSDSPDGELVEKGGVAQGLRTMYPTSRASRKVYTCESASGCTRPASPLDLTVSAYQFSTSNSAVVTAMSSNNLIDWIRGEENVTATTNPTNFDAAKDQLTSPPLTTTTALYPPAYSPPASNNTVRPSIHGDVLHSRPVALNYAAAGATPNVVVFYGANDGLLRAVNGNQSGSGSELWAFVASEHYGKLNRLRENTPEVKYPSTPATNTTATKRDYFFDGPIGAYQDKANNEARIFPAMRRGGNAVYGFDVSTPAAPKLMWSISPTKDSDFSDLGQTWSTPTVVKVKGRTDPVIVMGGGYDDAAEDALARGNTTKGNVVYVLDMKTGTRLARLTHPNLQSVPSDIALIDTDGDGYVDRAYFVDVRANVYRIDIEDSAANARSPSSWVVTRLANFNDAANSRWVFFAPDVVLTKNYTLLMIGTGDREKPLKGVTNDRFYMMKDRKVTKGEPEPTSVTVLNDSSPNVVPFSNTAYLADPDACYLELEKDGEKVVNQPVTFAGLTYFSTSKPSTSGPGLSCSTTKSRAYQIPLVCQAPTFTELVGDGLPPSPVVGYVEIGGTTKPFVIGGGANKSPIEVSRPNITIPGERRRAYWFMDNRDR